jgi:hypothetical protein
MEETREHRPDETAEQQMTREGTENIVRNVENAANHGLLSRRQADRVIKAGQTAHGSHDMARGLHQRDTER